MQVGSVVCLCREVYSLNISPALAPRENFHPFGRVDMNESFQSWRPVSDTRRPPQETLPSLLSLPSIQETPSVQSVPSPPSVQLPTENISLFPTISSGDLPKLKTFCYTPCWEIGERVRDLASFVDVLVKVH